MGITFGGRPCLDPKGLASACLSLEPPVNVSAWIGKPNSFTLPLGANPGTGWLLLRRGELVKLNQKELYDSTGAGSLNGYFDLVVDDDSQRVVIKDLIPTHARAITPGYHLDDDCPYLVQVCDKRILFAFSKINTAYNIRATPGGSYHAATTNGGTPWTWTGMVEAIWGNVVGIGTYPGLPFTPDGTPEGFAFWGANAWAALNDVLTRIGCAYKLNPLTGVSSIIRLGSDSVDATNALRNMRNVREWDDIPHETRYPRLPQYATVRFRIQPRPTDGTSEFHLENVEDTTQTDNRLTGTYAIIDDDLPAIYSGGAPTNQAAIDTRKAERAADWFRKARAFNRRDRLVYDGIQPDSIDILGSTYFEIAFEDRGSGYKTTIHAGPDHPEDFLRGWRPHVEFAPFGGSGSGSSFTVEEADGSPSSTELLKFQDTSLEDNGDGSVTVRHADATHSGLVDAVDGQVFNEKIINDAKGLQFRAGGAIQARLFTDGGSLLKIASGAGSSADGNLEGYNVSARLNGVVHPSVYDAGTGIGVASQRLLVGSSDTEIVALPRLIGGVLVDDATNGVDWLSPSSAADGDVLTHRVSGLDHSVEWAAPSAVSNVTDGDKGDISVSGGVWTIDSGVVSNAKLADLATQRVKGRNTAGTGAPEDVTYAQFMDWVSASVAQGDTLFRGSSNFERLAAGTARKWLETGGLGANPSWVGRHGCRVYASADLSLTNGTLTALACNSEDWDTAGYHSTSTNTDRITIPTGMGGIYLFGATAHWEASGAGNYRNLYLRLNGTDYIGQTNGLPLAGNARSEVFACYECAAGDYISLLGYQDFGGTLKIRCGAGTGADATNKYTLTYWCVYLGPKQ